MTEDNKGKPKICMGLSLIVPSLDYYRYTFRKMRFL